MGGTPYRILNQHLKNLSVDPAQDIVLEIGSERGDGSTEFLYNWAKLKGVDFYSVDVVKYTGGIFDNNGINFVVHESGSGWCKDILPSLNKKIKVLYLDNFDFVTAENENPEQARQYAERGVELCNENSMEEHRLQAAYCLPFMSEESVVIMDDTWLDEEAFAAGLPMEQTWHGKCTRVIPMLVQNFYMIESDSECLYAYRKKPGEWIPSKQMYTNDPR